MSQDHGNGGRYPGQNPGGDQAPAGDGSFGAQQQGWQPPHGGAQQGGDPQPGPNQPPPPPPNYAAQRPDPPQPPPGWQPPQAPNGGGPGGPAAPGQGGPGYGGAGGTEDGPNKSNKAVWIVSGIALVIIAALVTVLLFVLGDDDEEDEPTVAEEPTESEPDEVEPGDDEPGENGADEQQPEEDAQGAPGLEDDDDEPGLADEDDPFDAEDDTATDEEITDLNQALTQTQIEEVLLDASDMTGDVMNFQRNLDDHWFQHWVSLWPTEEDTVGARSEADASGDPDVEDFATCIELTVPLSDMDTANSAAGDFDAFFAEGGSNYINLGIVAPDATPDTDALWDEAADHCDVTLADRGAEFGFFDIDGVRGVGFREPGDDLWYSVELSMDMGENLLWVHAMEVTSEQLEEIVGAQTAKLEQFN